MYFSGKGRGKRFAVKGWRLSGWRRLNGQMVDWLIEFGGLGGEEVGGKRFAVKGRRIGNFVPLRLEGRRRRTGIAEMKG